MLHHESQVKILYLQVVPKPIWIYCQFSHPSSLESIPESHGTPSQGTAPVLISITFSPVFLFSPENLYHLCSRKKKKKYGSSQTLHGLQSSFAGAIGHLRFLQLEACEACSHSCHTQPMQKLLFKVISPPLMLMEIFTSLLNQTKQKDSSFFNKYQEIWTIFRKLNWLWDYEEFTCICIKYSQEKISCN